MYFLSINFMYCMYTMYACALYIPHLNCMYTIYNSILVVYIHTVYIYIHICTGETDWKRLFEESKSNIHSLFSMLMSGKFKYKPKQYTAPVARAMKTKPTSKVSTASTTGNLMAAKSTTKANKIGKKGTTKPPKSSTFKKAKVSTTNTTYIPPTTQPPTISTTAIPIHNNYTELSAQTMIDYTESDASFPSYQPETGLEVTRSELYPLSASMSEHQEQQVPMNEDSNASYEIDANLWLSSIDRTSSSSQPTTIASTAAAPSYTSTTYNNINSSSSSSGVVVNSTQNQWTQAQLELQQEQDREYKLNLLEQKQKQEYDNQKQIEIQNLRYLQSSSQQNVVETRKTDAETRKSDAETRKQEDETRKKQKLNMEEEREKERLLLQSQTQTIYLDYSADRDE